MSVTCMMKKSAWIATVAGAVLLLATAGASAGSGASGHSHGDHGKGHEQHGGGHHGHAGHMDHDNMPGGKPGDPKKVNRTVVILAKDTEFNLKSIQVKAGETIKFIIKNKGELVHEFTIGDPEMQKMHKAEMQKMMDEGKLMTDKLAPGAVHTHPNSAIVEPGQTKEVIWEFARDETLEFACNIPGHYEQGMKGKFQFTM